MAKIPGYQVVLQIDNEKIVGYRSNSMDMETDMANSTTGESANQFKGNMPMFKGAEFSVEGLYDPTTGASTTTAEEITAKLLVGTKVVAKYGGTNTGNKYYSVDAYIRRVHVEGPYDDLSSYTLDLLATGKPTVGTV